MVKVLEEVTSGEMTPEHVKRRVDDWVQRVKGLYSRIESWLPSGWDAEQGRSTRMHAELMRQVKLGPRSLPLLDIFRDRVRRATIEPRGLWIIGANGRLDLTTEKDHFVIIDAADNFEPPDWQIAPFSNRTDLKALDRESLLSILSK
ncbi:MAG: hypothetical protein ACHQAY_25080 [Hyphomicrobiales bacterium]